MSAQDQDRKARLKRRLRQYALPLALPLALCLSLPIALQAEESDGIAADALLSDRDFFRMATCGAPPGGDCIGPTIRWPKRTVTLSVLKADTAAPKAFTEALSLTVDQAIKEVNRSGAAVRILRIKPGSFGRTANIRVIPTDLEEGVMLEDIPGISAPGIMGVGYMTYWWNEREEITEATILISTTILASDMRSVVLEEIYQTLGPRFDIEGEAYEGVSILSQTSNETIHLRGQDARLLRWLYPAQK